MGGDLEWYDKARRARRCRQHRVRRQGGHDLVSSVVQDALQSGIEALRDQIKRVAGSIDTDSPAFLFLDGLRVSVGSPRALARDDRTYEILNDSGAPIARYVGYRSGDLKELRDERAVDFWTNSENVLMQMARISERSVSATIRYLGARQPDAAAPGFDDTIAVDLARQLGTRQAVDEGEVLVTTSGRLRETHGVKAILHAAVVTGSPGRSFRPIADDLLIETARRVIETARGLIRSGQPEFAGRSLIMPLFGTGQGRLDPAKGAEQLLTEVVQNLSYHASISGGAAPDLTMVLFSTFTEAHVRLFQRALDAMVDKGVLRQLTTNAPGTEPAHGQPTP